jgi:surface polysaccharide O-acyltransferase-like enzyme
MGKIIAERNIFFDLLRVVAMAGVVMMHTAAGFVNQFNGISFFNWMATNFFDSSLRFCVPVFVMISGALLLKKDCEYVEFYKKRASKILIPLIFWTIFYTCWSLFVSRRNLNWHAILLNTLNGSAYYHLWFIYLIVGLYIITPFLRKMVKYFSDRDFKWFIFIWLIFGGVVPLFSKTINYFLSEKMFVTYDMLMFVVFVGFFVVGYYLTLRADNINIRTSLKIYIASILTTALGTYLLTSRFGELDEFFYGMSLNVFAESIAIYFLFKSICDRTDWEKHYKQKKFIQTISDLSFGIYLVHPVPLGILALLAARIGFTNPFLFVPAIGTATLILTAAACFVIKKIPVANRLI